MRHDDDYGHDDHDEGPEGICSDCGKACHAKMIDFGIGSYEFWGARGVHTDFHPASPCCEVEVVEGGESVVRRAVHVARRDHKDGKIKAGDKYSLTVYRTWRKDGPHWIHTTKRKVA